MKLNTHTFVLCSRENKCVAATFLIWHPGIKVISAAGYCHKEPLSVEFFGATKLWPQRDQWSITLRHKKFKHAHNKVQTLAATYQTVEY